MAKQVFIREQTVNLDDVKWAALNQPYDEPVPSMEAVSAAVEHAINYLTDPYRMENV